MKKISFIVPSRNNLQYLKWSYNSLRKHCDPSHEICMYDDFSNDGTWKWLQEVAEKDKNVRIFRNEGPTRLGHTILYDRLIDSATNEIIMIWHADMHAIPGMDTEISDLIKPKTVVSVTRIEPPIHPPGPEKILAAYGTEPEQFIEKDFLEFAEKQKSSEKTKGMFAPWAIHKEDFLKIGGHDPLFAPQSREDSDIFNRFILAGYEPIQTWNSFCYHMTCRGSRFQPQLTTVGTPSIEWLIQNRRSERNFIRKWGAMVKHDNYLRPIIPHKYQIAYSVSGATSDLLHFLEPYSTRIFTDLPISECEKYIKEEQPNTFYDLTKRVFPNEKSKTLFESDIMIKFDARKATRETFNYVAEMPFILGDQLTEVGNYQFDIFTVIVSRVKHYERELIFCDKSMNR